MSQQEPVLPPKDLSNGYYLSSIRLEDTDAFMEHLQDKEIYDFTVRLPWPGTEEKIKAWIRGCQRLKKALRQEVIFAIRRPDDYLVGVIGGSRGQWETAHRMEVGYWVAKSHWNRGIMTRALKAYCRYSFDVLKLKKLTATIFSNNPRSMRVAEKCGFQQEGEMKAHYFKEGELIDVAYFSLLASEFEPAPLDKNSLSEHFSLDKNPLPKAG